MSSMRAREILTWLAIILASGLVLVEIVTFLSHIGYVMITAIGATFLAFLVFPAVRCLNWRLPLWAALTIVYSGVLLAVALVFWYIIPNVLTQIQALSHDLPLLERKASAALRNPDIFFSINLPAPLRNGITHLPERIGALLQRESGSISASLVNVVASVALIAALAIAIPVVSIYMLAESGVMKRSLLGILPESAWARTLSLLNELEDAVGGFIRGQLIVAAVVATLVTCLLLALGVPYALLIGVFAGAVDVIPYAGAIAGYLPAAIVSLISNGMTNTLYLTIGFIAINQFEGHVIVPRIVGSTVRLRPLAVIFALLVGGELFGLPGLIVAVPIAGMIRVLINAFLQPHAVPRAVIRPALSHQPRSRASNDE